MRFENHRPGSLHVIPALWGSSVVGEQHNLERKGFVDTEEEGGEVLGGYIHSHVALGGGTPRTEWGLQVPKGRPVGIESEEG